MSEIAAAPSPIDRAAELLAQLKAARQWLAFFVDELELDPEVRASSLSDPTASRELARVPLAESLAKIDAAIAAEALA